jgi:hypothetical protein
VCQTPVNERTGPCGTHRAPPRLEGARPWRAGSSIKTIHVMTRPPSDDSIFSHSSVPGWQPTAPDDGRGLRAAASARSGPTRAPQRRSLTDEAHVWLARLPPRFQPLATARLHPHIVNRLAELWANPERLPTYFSELLLSRREGRQGFAFEVLTELFDLQALLQDTKGPRRH